MADNFVDINPVTEKDTEKPLFQVAVLLKIKANGDDRAASMPLHQVPLEIARQEKQSNAVEVLSEFTGALKDYRQRRMSLAEIEHEETRLREDYAYYEGESKVDVFSAVYGDPANCRFVEIMRKICVWWNQVMARPETLTDAEVDKFARSLLPQRATPGTIDFVPMPGEIELEEEPKAELEGAKSDKPTDEEKPAKAKRGRKKAVEPDKTLDPDAAGETRIDFEILEHIQSWFTDEEQALCLARMATVHGANLTNEQLANVPGFDSDAKFDRARDCMKAFKKQ